MTLGNCLVCGVGMGFCCCFVGFFFFAHVYGMHMYMHVCVYTHVKAQS